MRLKTKAWPLKEPHPAFPDENFDWAWIINVKLIHKHSPPTKWVEAWIDSGSPWCIFHSSFCRLLGIDLESGIREDLRGVAWGPSAPMFFHKINIVIGSSQFETMAGFSSALAVAGILGRHGFFENFSVSFDPLPYPPEIELNQVNRV